MAHQSPAAANMYYNDPSYTKFFHCRNPIIRLLSAWISKNAYSKNPIPFAADYPTFEDFVHVIPAISIISKQSICVFYLLIFLNIIAFEE